MLLIMSFTYSSSSSHTHITIFVPICCATVDFVVFQNLNLAI